MSIAQTPLYNAYPKMYGLLGNFDGYKPGKVLMIFESFVYYHAEYFLNSIEKNEAVDIGLGYDSLEIMVMIK